MLPWWWRRHVPPKHWFLQETQGVTSQKTAFFIVHAVKPHILHSINRLGSVAETWCFLWGTNWGVISQKTAFFVDSSCFYLTELLSLWLRCRSIGPRLLWVLSFSVKQQHTECAWARCLLCKECNCRMAEDHEKLLNFPWVPVAVRKHDSTAGVSTGYWLDNSGPKCESTVGSRILISPCTPNRLWRPHNLLSYGYPRLFPRG
jgi:hypothetical protein